MPPEKYKPSFTYYANPLPLSVKLSVWLFLAVYFYFMFKPFFVLLMSTILIYLTNVTIQKVRFSRKLRVVENNPPDKLRPAEIGLLYDQRLGAHELASIYLYLISSGHIQLEIKSIGSGLMSGNHVLTATNKDRSDLRAYERYFLEKIFSFSNQTETLLESDNPTLNSHLAFMVKQELQTRGYYFFYDNFTNDNFSEAQGKIRAAIFRNWKNIFRIGQGEERFLTEKGKALWLSIAGFRHYLLVAEKERVSFHSDPKKGKEIHIDPMTPYAVAFGIDTEWENELFGWRKGESD